MKGKACECALVLCSAGPSLTRALSREDHGDWEEAETVPTGEAEILKEILKDAFNINRLNT